MTIEEKVAEKFSLTKKLAKEVVQFVVAGQIEELVTEGALKISGLGTFTVKDKNAREGRNPKTGEIIQVAAKKAVAFKAGKAIKEAVNA